MSTQEIITWRIGTDRTKILVREIALTDSDAVTMLPAQALVTL